MQNNPEVAMKWLEEAVVQVSMLKNLFSSSLRKRPSMLEQGKPLQPVLILGVRPGYYIIGEYLKGVQL